MKTWSDVVRRACQELEQWRIRQERSPFEDFYLYYLESNSEHDGGIIIAANRPPNAAYQLATPVRIDKSLTVTQNLERLIPALRMLPILSIRRETAESLTGIQSN